MPLTPIEDYLNEKFGTNGWMLEPKDDEGNQFDILLNEDDDTPWVGTITIELDV